VPHPLFFLVVTSRRNPRYNRYGVLGALVTGDVPQGMDRALLNNKFRILPVPSTHTLEGFQYGHNIITCVENDVMHVLFRGTRNNNESWRPKIARLETMLLSIARN